MDLSFNQTSMDLRERFFNLLDSLSALRALSQINLERVTEAELLAEALDELVRYQNIDHCSVFRMEAGVLRCVSGRSMAESHAEITGTPSARATADSMAFKPGEGIVGIAYSSAQLQYCRDCSQSSEFKPHDSTVSDMPGSLISAPIKMGDKVLGVLNASHPMAEYFEPWQQHTLSLFSSCLGQILYNHQMLHELEILIDQRTEELGKSLEEANRLRKRYEQLSMVDELTGLHNRRFFFNEAEAHISRAIRSKQPCSLMLVDVDHFKRVNDQWGHLVGDQVLAAISRILMDEARGGDLVARVGGEEFVILLPEAGIEGADLMAQRIQERLTNINMGNSHPGIKLTVSIGMTELTKISDQKLTPSQLVDQLYSQADQAMYECKREGRNRRIRFKEPVDD
ncbi:MAG: sensor domain-containing diguanylate cyclase [Candidatus Thiodiazotropha weberae]|nr:sensor domain-containing diguanylate cyclase [Candidatus Thiodiazotropha weberae]